jgi:GT2 family glycosyltransferase
MEIGDVAIDSENSAARLLLASYGAIIISNKPQVTVVIVSFNTRELLRECIESLQDGAGGVRFETVVVDNASRDGSADMVAAQFSDVQLIRSETNLGFARANNRGFEVARGRYIVLLNSDAFLKPGALALSVEHMEKNPMAGLGGARLVGRDGSWQPAARMFPSPLNDLLMMSGLAANYPTSQFFGRADRTWADPSEAAVVDWVPGAYSIIRKDVLNRIGGFDQRFFLYYEEVDLCRRIRAAGYEIWYWPDVVTVHLGGESSRKVSGLELSSSGSQLTLWRMRSELLYYRKHHGAFGAWSAMLLESWWNRARALRNARARTCDRRDKNRAARATVAMMLQAWRETSGGVISPPQPW